MALINFALSSIKSSFAEALIVHANAFVHALKFETMLTPFPTMRNWTTTLSLVIAEHRARAVVVAVIIANIRSRVALIAGPARMTATFRQFGLIFDVAVAVFAFTTIGAFESLASIARIFNWAPAEKKTIKENCH